MNGLSKTIHSCYVDVEFFYLYVERASCLLKQQR